MGEKSLGAKLQHDGIELHNVEWFREKVVSWADKVCTGKLSKELAWKALNLTILKSVEYPLAATSFLERQYQKMMAPALMLPLNQAGIQSRMPHTLVYGPTKTQGLGLHDIQVTQLIEHLEQLMRHAGEPMLTGELLGNCIEGIQLGTALSKPLWELSSDDWGKCVTKSWVCSTWIEIHKFNVTIEDTYPKLPNPIPGDYNLMDVFNRGTRNSHINVRKQIAWCREYLNVIYLSDLVNPDGETIKKYALEGVRLHDF